MSTDAAEDADEAADADGEPPMTKLNVRVPQSMADEIEAVYAERGYTSTSEFVRGAIRDALEPPRELSDEVLAQIAESQEQLDAGEYTEIE